MRTPRSSLASTSPLSPVPSPEVGLLTGCRQAHLFVLGGGFTATLHDFGDGPEPLVCRFGSLSQREAVPRCSISGFKTAFSGQILRCRPTRLQRNRSATQVQPVKEAKRLRCGESPHDGQPLITIRRRRPPAFGGFWSCLTL